ncbi:MAG: hypothetical protein ACI9ME_001844 [Ilumatobacter sp.]
MIVTTERPPPSALSAGIHTEVITSRRNWKQAPEQWPEYAAGRLRIFGHGRAQSTPKPSSEPTVYGRRVAKIGVAA